MALHGIRDAVAIVGMLHDVRRAWDCSTDELIDASLPLGRRRTRRHRRLLARHDGFGRVRPDAQPAAEDRLQAGHGGWRTCAPPGPRRLRNACYAVASGAFMVAMAIGVEEAPKDSGYSGLVVSAWPTTAPAATVTAAVLFSCSPRPTPRSTRR